MIEVSAYEVKTHLAELLRKVQRGEKNFDYQTSGCGCRYDTCHAVKKASPQRNS